MLSVHLGCVTQSACMGQGFTVTSGELVEGKCGVGLQCATKAKLENSALARNAPCSQHLTPPAVPCCMLPGIAAKEVTAAALDKSWREVLSSLEGQAVLDAQAAAGLAAADFTVEYARQPLQALRLVQRALAAYREAQRGPCVATVQCPGGSARLQQDMPLLGDLPCVDKPVTPEDGR